MTDLSTPPSTTPSRMDQLIGFTERNTNQLLLGLLLVGLGTLLMARLVQNAPSTQHKITAIWRSPLIPIGVLSLIFGLCCFAGLVPCASERSRHKKHLEQFHGCPTTQASIRRLEKAICALALFGALCVGLGATFMGTTRPQPLQLQTGIPHHFLVNGGATTAATVVGSLLITGAVLGGLVKHGIPQRILDAARRLN